MAYTVPPQWAHGDYPTAANVNKFKTALDAVHDIVGDVQLNYPCITNLTVDKGYYFVHQYRWLHYRGDGEITDPAGAGDTVTISGDGNNFLVYDLLQVDWIYPGKLYEVKDVTMAAEDSEA